MASHHGDTTSQRIDTQGSSQKKSLSSYLNQASSAHQQQEQLDSQKKAYASMTSATGQGTANKLSGAKSNASESTTLKKVVPAHMVKPVTRHASQENSGHLSQNAINQKLFQRIRSSKVEKTNTATNLSVANSGTKGYIPQSTAARSLSQNNGLGQSTGETKASDSQVPVFVANLQKRSLQKQFESIQMKKGGDSDNKDFVVQSMQTANQRASSKSSIGSAHSFI